MNSLWCFLVLSIALVEGRGVLYNVPKEYLDDILKAAADCVDSTGVGSDAVQKVITANYENTEPFKQFLYCFCSTSGYINNKGHFNVDELTKLIGDHKDKNNFVYTVNKCNESKGDNVYETTYKTLSCFRDNSPLYFTI